MIFSFDMYDDNQIKYPLQSKFTVQKLTIIKGQEKKQIKKREKKNV